MAIDAISYIYAATVAAGGIIGYVKAGKFLIECNIFVTFTEPNLLNFLHLCRFYSVSWCGSRIWCNFGYVFGCSKTFLFLKQNVLTVVYFLLLRIWSTFGKKNYFKLSKYNLHIFLIFFLIFLQNSQSPPKPLFQLGLSFIRM